ncbi:MAG: prolipoprotein diacylglyceryl transferase [Ectothiorhodospiraceae bacterium AqS1]|nr:prolipoprotein diacylglyceryl transferase [Ectothiorhodospiraceae bacterium AqS1]
MLVHPGFDPVAIEVGPINIHWYGLMYLLAFGCGWWLGRRRARQEWRGLRPVDVDDLLFYIVLGVVIGGRLGYMFFYEPARLFGDPLSLLMIWQGGMSFHGGMIGVLVAVAWFAKRRGRGFFEITDFIAPLIPPGILAGRIGNFINGRLWGAPSDLPWAMVFPDPSAGGIPRHPSQLYEAFWEGLVLFALLWWFTQRPRPLMATSGLFLVGYASARILVEFVRMPDAHIGYIAFGWMTMGQLLTAPMLPTGVLFLALAFKGEKGR